MLLWNDDVGKIETRTSTRRILGNSNHEADFMIFKKAQPHEKKFRKAQNPPGKKLLQASQQKKSIRAVPEPNYFQTSQKRLSAPNSAQLSAVLPAQQLDDLLYTFNQLMRQQLTR